MGAEALVGGDRALAWLLYSIKQRMRPSEQPNKDQLHSTERGSEKALEAGLVPSAVPLDAEPPEGDLPTIPLPPQSGIIPQSFPIPASTQPTPRQVVTSAGPLASPFSPVFTSPLGQVQQPWSSHPPLRPPPHQGPMSSSSRLSLTPMTTIQPLQPNAGGAISVTILNRGSSLSTPAAKPVDPSNQRQASPICVSLGQDSTVGKKRPSERTDTEQPRAPPQLRADAAPSENALATNQSVNTLPIPSDRPIPATKHMVSPCADLDRDHVLPDLKRPWQYTGELAPGLDLYLAQLVLHELVDLSLYRSDGIRFSAGDPAGTAIRGPRGGRRGGHTTSTDYPMHEGEYLRDTTMGSDVGYGSRQYTGGYDPDEHQARDEGCGGRWWSWGTEVAFISD